MPSLEDQSKKLSKNMRGPVVKQFQWFQMETRLRKIIQQIVDPIQFQIVKNSSAIERLQKNDITFNDRIQYIMRMTTNDPQVFQKGVFKKIQDKFEAQQKTITFLEEQVKNNTIFIDNKINLIDQRMKESNDMISQIQELKTSNRQNLRHQTEKFETVRTNIQENAQKMSQAIEENQKTSREKIQNLQKQISLNALKMENIFKEFGFVKSYFETQKSLNDRLIAQDIRLQQENQTFDAKLVEINKKIKQLSKIKPFLQDIHNDYRKFLFKVDNIVPLINEAQINESLYRILPQKFHPRIAVYEFERYSQLNQKILSRHFEVDPTSINFNGQGLIRQSQQRNTKLLTKLKRQYYKNNGIDLDFISFEERQRLLDDFDYPKLCQIIEELEELENQKNDKKKNHRLTQEDIIKLVKKQLQSQKNVLIQKIHIQIQDSKIYLRSSTQQNQKAIENIQNKIHKLSQDLIYQKCSKQLINSQNQQRQKQFGQNLNKIFERLGIFQNFSKKTFRYLQKSFELSKKINLQGKKSGYFEKSYLAVKQTKKFQNEPINREENLKAKLGVMIMSDSDSNNQSSCRIIHEKDINSEPAHQFSEEETLKLLQDVKKSVLQFSNLDDQINIKNIRSKYSKLIRPQNNDIILRSQSCFYNSKECSTLKDGNKISEMSKDLSNQGEKGLLHIPQFKNVSGKKICRESYTSRFSMRKKHPLITPSKSQFSHMDKKQNIIDDRVRNSMSYFSELKKENSRYLN